MIQDESAEPARDRILFYFQKYCGEVIPGDELMVVAGISEYGRRVRELRVELGWQIISGKTARQINKSLEHGDIERMPDMKPDDYILLSLEQDRDAAFRWNVAHEIRNVSGHVRNKILQYLRRNVGKVIPGEELRYVANNKTEWARRVRELRIEHGWLITTKSTGRPELPPIGTPTATRGERDFMVAGGCDPSVINLPFGEG